MRSQHSYDDAIKNGMLKAALLLHADTVMLNWCVDSTTNTARRMHTQESLDDHNIGEVHCPDVQISDKCSIVES